MQAPGGAVVLADARTRYELDMIVDWARREHPGAKVVTLGTPAATNWPAEATLLPARVVWLPPMRDGERRVAVADLLSMTNPRHPGPRAQRRIGTRSPDRVQVVSGAPASTSELRARYTRSVAAGESFADFVGREAVLALERAQRQLIGDRYKVPRVVAEKITASASFRAKAAGLARELGRPEADVVAEATDKMAGFVAVQSHVAIDLFTAIFRTLHQRAWSVSVDLDTLERLRAINRSTALVFLPAHRSYLDPMVLADVLSDNDFPPNHVLGGENVAFWPIGPLGRRAGFIFIRRRFGTDPVYKFAMRSYLSYLVEKRFNLEWYLEGGRSRTGKLRPPMLGLLAYVVAAVQEHPGIDVTLVPTSIVYDQLAEVQAMAAEAAGGTKKAENFLFLLRYARAQRTYLGAARVRFGEPLSLRAALAEAGEGRAQLEKVAFGVLDRINRATPVSATSLASFALLGAESRAYTEAEIEQILEPLLRYIGDRGLPGPDPALCHGAGLRETLESLHRVGVLDRYDGGTRTVWSVSAGNHAIAAYYRNGAIHHLVNRAIVELVLLGVADRAVTGEDRDGLLTAAWAESLRIRDLLKFEFFFPDKPRFRAESLAELELLAPGWDSRPADPAAAAAALRGAPVLVARRTLQAFFDAQLVVAEQLVALGGRTVDEGSFLASCLGVGRQMLLQGRVLAPDSVSRELYASAFKLAANRGLTEGNGTEPGDVRRGRVEFRGEIARMRARLAQIAQFEAGQPGHPDPGGGGA
jgi:glycerol-3-phosphate O-acyltransferase